MSDAELRRKSREYTERVFTNGLYKTLIEIAFMAIVGGIGCIYAVLLAWEYVIKPMVGNGLID